MAPILGGVLLNCLLSVGYTVLVCRLLSVPSDLSISLVARFITLPMAVPVTEALHGSVALSSLSACIQGVAGAALCLPLLDLVGVRGRLARGYSLFSLPPPLPRPSPLPLSCSLPPLPVPENAITTLATRLYC